MKINFTGIKSPSYKESSRIDKQRSGCGEKFETVDTKTLTVRLTDDNKGSHLSNFKKALKHSGLSFRDYGNGDLVKIVVQTETSGAGIKNDEEVYKDIFLNNKQLRISQKTQPVFSFISRLLDEIALKQTTGNSRNFKNPFAISDGVAKLQEEISSQIYDYKA